MATIYVSLCLFPVLMIPFSHHKTEALLCYDGTFNHTRYGEDPLEFRGIFGLSRGQMARLRCSHTIPCPVISELVIPVFLVLCLKWLAGGMLCYNCTSAHNERANCAGAFSPAAQPFYNDRDLLVNCTGDGALCFVRAWAARSRYAWMVQRGCYHPNKDDPVPRAMTVPTRAMACRLERFAEAEYKVCFCQSDWCNSTSVLRVQLVFVIIFSLIFVMREME